MSLSIPEFWKLVVDSRLLTAEQCQKLEADFGQVKGAASQSNAKGLVEWLVSKQALSRYQSTVLLAGRAGPFYYGDYRVYDRIEQGTLAGQFRAVHAPTGHPVMLRFLGGSVLQDNREWALVAARVQQHAEVVSPPLQRYFEPVDLTAFRFLASEDLRGETLDELLAKYGRLPPSEAARVIRQIALAVASMHRQGVAHGDVRPANFLFEPSGNIKLLVDPARLPAPLNFAQLDPSSPDAAKTDYLAPEFLQPGKQADDLTDVYALGCAFYQLLTGQPPFAGGLPGQKLARHAAEPIQPLEPYGVPFPLAQLVAFMMAKNPKVRTQQAGLIAEQLTPFIDPARLQGAPSAPSPTLAAYESWIRQKQSVLAAAEQAKASAPQGPVIRAVEAGTVTTPVGVAIGSVAGTPVGTAVAVASSRATPGLEFAAKKSSPAKRLKKSAASKQQELMMIAGGAVAVAVMVLVIVVVASNMGDEPVEVVKNPKPPVEVPTTNVIDKKKPSVEDPSQKKQPPGETKKKPPEIKISVGPPDKEPIKDPMTPESTAGKFEVQPDDGKLLWASPTSGGPVELSNVPPNARIFAIARPADMLVSPSGQQVLEALGPTFGANREAWEKAAGVTLENIVQVVIALHDNELKMPRPSYRITLKTPLPEAELIAKWGNPASQDEGGKKYFAGAGRAYYIASESVFTMGDPQDIKELALVKGAPPPMVREVDQLRRLTDNERHFTLLASPKYLTGDGRELFSGAYQKLLSPIDWFLGEDAKGAMLSMHFGVHYYVELRETTDSNLDKTELAANLKSRLAEVPKHIEDYIVALNPPPYWKKVANRYPGMIYFLYRNTRVGVEDDVAMINAVAPGALAHNLLFGGELALASAPGAAVAVGTPAGTGNMTPKTIDDVLKHKITFEEPGNDMNLVMAALEKEVTGDLPGLPFEFGIRILGKDLQLEGITRNQAIRNFKMQDTSLADVLTGLVRKANPITTVKDPSEADQKLVWVVGPDPDKPDQQVILITTRKAAETKKYNLKAPFVK